METEVELLPIRGRTYGLHRWGKVHWGVLWPDGDRDGQLWSLCCTAENRHPVYGYRLHPRIEVECKHCLEVARKLAAR